MLLFPKRSSVRLLRAGRYWASVAVKLIAGPRSSPRTGLLPILALVPIAVVAVALLSIGLFLPARLSVDGVSAPLSPDTPVSLYVAHLGTTISNVDLTEETIDTEGQTVGEHTIPVELVPAPGIVPNPYLNLQLQRRDGSRLLEYDRAYHLRISWRAKVLAFPVPEEVAVTRDYQFRTPISPQLRMSNALVQMAYMKPLELLWNSPIQSFSLEIRPQVQVRSWVDPSRPDMGYVELEGAPPGAQYQVTINGALGANGVSMLAPVTLTVETAASPKPIADSMTLENGDRVTIRWDRPVKQLEYQIAPNTQSSLEIDPVDPRITYISMKDPMLRQEYKLRVTGGQGTTGAPIAPGTEFSFVTPPPLEVTKLSPRGGSYGVRLGSAISITFSEAIANRAAAQAAISFEPALEGRFEWPDVKEIRFVPANPLPDNTEIAVHIAAGRKGVRATNGSYFAEDYDYSFLTQPDKLIDVNLANQTITLYEGDKVVYTGLVAAGVAGAPTPTGSFMVNFKMASTRMRGINPDGSHYDIPNVPWVMSFQGDYTLHGAPWRSRFGYPGSAGCVSMETSQAKMLFDWAPVGTPVRIHS